MLQVCLTVASKHQKGIMTRLILCNAWLSFVHLHKTDGQALTFLCISDTFTHDLPQRRFQGVRTTMQFELICMQALDRPDERVVHGSLMDRMIGSALTSEPREGRAA